MPLKLTVGLSKKIGFPDYGSVGASCHVEVELDIHLLTNNPTAFQQQTRQAFQACSQVVDDELARHVPRNGHTPANGQHQNGHSRSNGRHATASQVRAISAIANRQKLDLAQELRTRFGVDRPEDLSVQDASQFIDQLKGTTPQNNGGTR